MDVGEIESFEKNSLGKNVRKRLEIDFVVHRGRAITYIQVAYRIDSPEKQDQEFASFRKLPDSFKKILLLDRPIKLWHTNEGFIVMSLRYFLLTENALEF